MSTLPINEVNLIERTISVMPDPIDVRINIGFGCGHDYGHQLVEGSTIFEVISLDANQVTVIDIDQDSDLSQEGPGYIEGGPHVEPDARVETGRGLQLVYLRPGVKHPAQDPAYQKISVDQRGWWGMRTHDKMPEEAPQPLGSPGRLRNMVGLTNAGRQFAMEWNACATYADKLRQQRIEAGVTHVKDGKIDLDKFKARGGAPASWLAWPSS